MEKNKITMIEDENQPKIWVSSDFHLLHKSIAGEKVSNWKTGFRDFNNEYEMTEEILKQVNKYVKWNDILYFLGDFCFKNHKKIPELRNRINCQTIHFVKGNHDQHIDKYKDFFTSVQDYLTVEYYNQTFILFHYPILSWWHIGHGTLMLHGHCHSHENINKQNEKCKRIDVGIDHAYKMFGEYRPFEITEVIKILNSHPLFSVDGH